MLLPNKNKITFKGKVSILLLTFFYLPLLVSSQCPPNEIPFKNGERLDYDVYYHFKKMWVPAGKVRFEVKDSIYNGKSCFHFDGKGKSLKSYDYFFKVRDHYASLVEKSTLIPVRFVRKVNEGSFSLYYDYRFHPDKQEAIVYTNENDTTKKQKLIFRHCIYDVITAVYYARTLDFSNSKINDTIPLSMMVDKEIYENVYIRYTGKERIKGQDGAIYNCIKFRPLLIEGTIFEEGEYMEVFVTDDRNHIPIFIEAQILVGSIKAYISSYSNLKYEMTAKLR